MFYDQVPNQLEMEFRRTIPLIGITLWKPDLGPKLIKKVQRIESYILKKEKTSNYKDLLEYFIVGSFKAIHISNYSDILILTPKEDIKLLISKQDKCFMILGNYRKCLASLNFPKCAGNGYSSAFSYLMMNIREIVPTFDIRLQDNSGENEYLGEGLFEDLLKMSSGLQNMGSQVCERYRGLCMVRKRIKDFAAKKELVFLYPLYLERIFDD